MKKRVLYLLLAVFLVSFSGKSQVSLIGVGSPGGSWSVDTDLTDAGGGIWTGSAVIMLGGDFKFRLNHDWGTNWGSTTWPTGTGTQGGANIPSIAGTYDVTFDQNTGAYSFSSGAPVAIVKIVGTAVSGGELLLSLTAADTYSAKDVTFLDGTAKFDVDGVSYSDSAFPSGIAAEAGPAIAVTAGTWNLVYHNDTGAYEFSVPPVKLISLIGDAVGGWGVDTDLATTDGGLTYFINGVVIGTGECKFRQDHDWNVSWGIGASNITNTEVPAGTYNVTFDRLAGTFVFKTPDGTQVYPALSTKGFNSLNFKAYPNPTQNVWNFTSTNERIETIQIVDVLGKNVLSVSPKNNTVSVDASSLTRGIYFAKIATAKANETLKLMKN